MKRMISLAAAAALSTLPTQAEPYTLLIYETEAQLGLRPGSSDATAAYWQAYDVFGKQLAAAGVLRGGSALTSGAPVALLAAGKPEDAATAYATAPLALGGYFQIDVPSDAEAIAWAGRMPVIDGVVEVRAGYPVPGMAM